MFLGLQIWPVCYLELRIICNSMKEKREEKREEVKRKKAEEEERRGGKKIVKVFYL